LPACMIAGGDFVEPDANSRRSGTFVYRLNPRGGGYDATTIGTVIAGGWSSHEEMHVWQARLFGLSYIPIYLLSLLLKHAVPFVCGKAGGIHHAGQLQDLFLGVFGRFEFRRRH
jgi:hypothetical protein